MRLLFVRHGLSVANLKGLVTGTVEDPLSPAGREQARTLSISLGKRIGPNTTVYCSQWRRARETAEILLPVHQPIIDRRLGETDAGEAADWPFARFSTERPEFWGAFSPSRKYPNGESHEDMYSRAVAWFLDASKSHASEEQIIAITHSGPISAIFQYILGIDLARFPAFLPAPASVSVVDTVGPFGRAAVTAFSACGNEEGCS